MGGKFWLGLIGGCIALVVAFGFIWFIVGGALVKWGFFGSMLVLFGILALFAWIVDRRDKRRGEGEGVY